MVCFLGGKVSSTESECQEFMDLYWCSRKNCRCAHDEGMYGGEEPLLLIEYEAGWPSELVWMFWKGDNSFPRVEFKP